MFDLAGLGSFIGGIGSMFGGLHGHARTLANEQMELQQDALYKGVQIRAADARAAGISPLAALGANLTTPSATALPQGPDYAAGASQAARGLDRMLNQKQAQLLDAQIRKTNAEADAVAMQAKNSAVSLTAHMLNGVGRPRPASLVAPMPGHKSAEPTDTGTQPLVAAPGISITASHRSSADDFSQRYGDVVGETAGIYGFLQDLSRMAVHNLLKGMYSAIPDRVPRRLLLHNDW